MGTSEMILKCNEWEKSVEKVIKDTLRPGPYRKLIQTRLPHILRSQYIKTYLLNEIGGLDSYYKKINYEGKSKKEFLDNIEHYRSEILLGCNKVFDESIKEIIGFIDFKTI